MCMYVCVCVYFGSFSYSSSSYVRHLAIDWVFNKPDTSENTKFSEKDSESLVACDMFKLVDRLVSPRYSDLGKRTSICIFYITYSINSTHANTHTHRHTHHTTPWRLLADRLETAAIKDEDIILTLPLFSSPLEMLETLKLRYPFFIIPTFI